MRLSGPIKSKPVTPRAQKEPVTPAVAPPPACYADLPAPATAGNEKARATWATKAESKNTQTPPPARSGRFSLSAPVKKKNITPAPEAPPVARAKQEPAAVKIPAQAADEPFFLFAPQKSVPVTANTAPVSPARPEPAAGIGMDNYGLKASRGMTLGRSEPMTKEPRPSSPPPQDESEKEVVAVNPPPGISKSAPPPAKTDAPPDTNLSLYNEAPAGIYEICRQFGIEVPKDRTTAIEQAKACLITVFKKILQPAPERFMIWPMIKSIASDIEGFVASNTAILNALHRNRLNGDKLVWHSIYTAILAMGIAKNEKKLSCSLFEIGGAALLHDIGLLMIKGGFDDIEDENVRECAAHVTKGLELVNKLDIPDVVVEMIAQHHGRLDGKGFPKDLSHSTFGRCSQILAIANVSELVVCNLSVAKKEDANAGEGGIAVIFKEYRQAFDTDLLKKIIALIGFYPAGSMVELNNHLICKVVRQNTDFPLRPVVEVVMDSTGMHPEEEKLIDLKEVKILSVIRTLASPEIKNITLK